MPAEIDFEMLHELIYEPWKDCIANLKICFEEVLIACYIKCFVKCVSFHFVMS